MEQCIVPVKVFCCYPTVEDITTLYEGMQVVYGVQIIKTRLLPVYIFNLTVRQCFKDRITAQAIGQGKRSNVQINGLIRATNPFLINTKIIIDGSVFTLPLFDFGRYCQLLKNPVTILSDDCWGGYVYNRLKMPFSSPLINIFWDKDEYSEFIQDPMFYLGTELKLFHEGNLKAGLAPVGQLGDGERIVKLMLIHNTSFAEAKEQWDRRMKRVNTKNLFVKMGFETIGQNWEKWLHIFSDVPYKKILFCSGECHQITVFYGAI